MEQYYPGKVVAGLDIGTSKVAMVVGVMGEDGLVEIRAHALHPHKAIIGGKINQDKTIEVISKVIAEVQSKLDVPIKEVNISMGGTQKFHLEITEKSVIRENAEAPISFKEIERIQKDVIHSFSVQKVHPLLAIPQDFYFDDDSENRFVDPTGYADVSKISCQILTIGFLQQNMIQINSIVKKAGMDISNRFIDVLSAAHALIPANALEEGVALVDIGHTTTKIAVFKDGILRYINYFPWGGAHITADIEEACGLTNSNATALKERYGVAVPEMAEEQKTIMVSVANKRSKAIKHRTLSCIVSGRLVNIAEMVHLALLESGYSGKLGHGLVLTGGSAGFPHIDVLFSKATGEIITIGNVGQKFQRKVEKLEKAIQPLTFSTVLGLVLAGYFPQDIREANFMERDKERREEAPIGETANDTKEKGSGWSFKSAIGNLLKDTNNLGEY